jgi:hypothetical protein
MRITPGTTFREANVSLESSPSGAPQARGRGQGGGRPAVFLIIALSTPLGPP